MYCKAVNYNQCNVGLSEYTNNGIDALITQKVSFTDFVNN